MFEYLWMNDIPDISVATKDDFLKLQREIALGGWERALRLSERLAALEANEELIADRKYVPTFGDPIFDFAEAIGTNYSAIRRKYHSQQNKEPSAGTAGRTFSSSRLHDIFDGINLIYDIGPEYGTKFAPYQSALADARKLGRPSERTKNLKADTAAKLLKEACRWIYEYGPPTAALLEDIASESRRCRSLTRKYFGRRLIAYFLASEARAHANRVLPFPIEALDFGRVDRRADFSLRTAVLCTMSAAFVCIAAMNARRRDEIIHPKFGLRRGDLQVVSEELRIYKSLFYIEKSYQERRPFYVNSLTADAIKLLERLESCFASIDADWPPNNLQEGNEGFDGRPLFSYRRFSLMKGVGVDRKWYDFDNYQHSSDAAMFLRIALGDKHDFKAPAHQFRRMYALLFYYQYENGDLVSLSRQLGHLDLTTTLVYVTDSSSRADYEGIRAVSEFRQLVGRTDLRKQLEIVGYEKLAEEIDAILAGEARFGGYVKFVNRARLLIARSAFYSSNEQLGTALFELIRRRGHFPKPMRHGQCMAGGAPNLRGARCYSENTGTLMREKAGMATCYKCIFHLSSRQYLENTREDLAELDRTAVSYGPETIKGAAVAREATELRRIITLMDARLAREGW
ncbi:hypothetical protein [Niveibacterium sp. SC-1]|uniref:hypothetical protein n=1 Tax=Niveibacterium sp. SC-1 TaxID=3135646 RepID=UPI00311F63E3